MSLQFLSAPQYKIKHCFVIIFFFMTCNLAWAGNCESEAEAAKFVESFRVTFEQKATEIKLKEQQRQAELSKKVAQVEKNKGWGKGGKPEFFSSIMSSNKFRNLENNKAEYLKEMQQNIIDMTAAHKTPITACQYACIAINNLKLIGTTNKLQYLMFEEGLFWLLRNTK